jgi:hypothetical protein
MSRATYCRDQARFCRELAAQLSVPQERASLRQMADRYDAEATALESTQAKTEQQQREPHGQNR